MYCCALLLRYKENCPSSSESSDQNFLDGETQGSKEQGRGSSKNQQKHADTTKVKHDSPTVFTLHMFFFLKKTTLHIFFVCQHVQSRLCFY
jgi:hypothetical protein